MTGREITQLVKAGESRGLVRRDIVCPFRGVGGPTPLVRGCVV